MTINHFARLVALGLPLAVMSAPAAAQSHDIEVMVDDRGRRVLIDTRTGEFLGYANQGRQRRGSVLDRLLDKLDATTRTEAAVRAARMFII